MNDTVVSQIASLPSLDNKELLKMWESFFDNPPRSHNRLYILKRLAWRIQEVQYGGLAEETKDQIQKLNKKSSTHINSRRFKALPAVGAQITREYHGKEHHVMVLPHGFEYDGAYYGSLSEIARKITGTRWSGPRFFGLKK